MTLRNLTIFLLLVGLVLFTYSLTLPHYKNETKTSRFYIYQKDIPQHYYNPSSNHRTLKVPLMDIGAGVAIAAGSVLLFLMATRSKNISDIKRLRTLNKTILFISSNLVWLLLLPGTNWYYLFSAKRGDYHIHGDSIAIPIVILSTIILFSIIPLNIFLLLTAINSKLPTKLFPKINKYNGTIICYELFFWFWILINLLCFYAFVSDGMHLFIPVNLFFTYILLNLRAGKISKYFR